MKSRLLLIPLVLMLTVASVQPIVAEEPYIEFLQGLRERNYFDYGLLYLDQLSQRPTLRPEMRPVILYEKAITLREYAKVLRNPEKQFEQLDKSLAFLEQFAAEYPDHPYAADANYDRSQILLQKAEVEIFQSKSPSNKGSKSEFQRRAREFVQKSRDVLKLAFDQHEMAFQKFPTFIDELKEPKLHAERAKVERSLILESLNLAKCTYQEAQTYDSAAREFKTLLLQASDEFENVYKKYRNYVGGSNARVWQGKCFEERGDFQAALGYYNEILDSPGDEQSLVNLKSQTLLFKLICLHQRDEHQLVVDLADEWLKKNGSESKTSIGLGIQWEQARAYEALGDNRNLPPPDQQRYWRQARVAAQSINRFPGEYKEVSLLMGQRLQTKLGVKEKKPDDFEGAYGIASQAFEQSQEIKKELDAATKSQKSPEEINRLKQDWNSSLNEAAKNFELASTLINRKDNPKEIANSRRLHAYTNFFLRRYYEAAILSQFIARTSVDDDTGISLEMAHLAMAAYYQAYADNRAEPARKLEDLRFVIKAANLITERWPESDKANEARMTLGQMYTSANKPSEAAEWFSKIPQSDPKFPEAQLAAGQAYWIAYGASSRLAPEMRPTTEKLTEWKAVAETHLRTGIDKLAASLPKEGSVPKELVSSKIYLAEILLNQGKAADAVKMLLDDPQSIVKAIAVPDEAKRPTTGVQSRSVAKSVYSLLLSAYINLGNDKLNEARDAMKTLESIAAGDPSSDLTELYVGLGRSLKMELERYRNNGETERFTKLMDAFEVFLDDMFKKQDGQTLGSLSWIGETYLTLGEISTDKSKTASYQERATSALNRIMTRSQNESSFATSDQLLNVKVRLVHCNRLKRDFDAAEQLLIEVLKVRGNDLKTQFEGAYVYQDWGSNGEFKKFVFAIGGRKEIGLWGWGGIAQRVQKQKNFAERADLSEMFIDARYNVSLCRFRYGKELPGKEKQKAFDLCAMELVGSASIMKSIPDEKREKLNQLYRQVLQENGKKVTDLPRSDEFALEPKKTTDEPVAKENPSETLEPTETEKPKPQKKQTESKTAAAASSGSDTTTLVIFLGFLIAGAGVIGWVLVTSGKAKGKSKGSKGSVVSKTKKSSSTQKEKKESPIAFSGIAIDEALPPSFSMPITSTKPRTKLTASKGDAPPSAGTPGSERTAQRPVSRPAARPDTGATPAPRPRPKPPSPPPSE